MCVCMYECMYARMCVHVCVCICARDNLDIRIYGPLMLNVRCIQHVGFVLKTNRFKHICFVFERKQAFSLYCIKNCS
jgi:hypothetical protein